MQVNTWLRFLSVQTVQRISVRTIVMERSIPLVDHGLFLGKLLWHVRTWCLTWNWEWVMVRQVKRREWIIWTTRFIVQVTRRLTITGIIRLINRLTGQPLTSWGMISCHGKQHIIWILGWMWRYWITVFHCLRIGINGGIAIWLWVRLCRLQMAWEDSTRMWERWRTGEWNWCWTRTRWKGKNLTGLRHWRSVIIIMSWLNWIRKNWLVAVTKPSMKGIILTSWRKWKLRELTRRPVLLNMLGWKKTVVRISWVLCRKPYLVTGSWVTWISVCRVRLIGVVLQTRLPIRIGSCTCIPRIVWITKCIIVCWLNIRQERHGLRQISIKCLPDWKYGKKRAIKLIFRW